MSGIDSSPVPSVHARLAELRQQPPLQQSYRNPSRPPPPPPVAAEEAKKKTAPPLPLRAPSLPPRRTTTDFSVGRAKPELPVRVPLPARTATTSCVGTARKLVAPPPKTGTGSLHSGTKSIEPRSLPPRTIPPLPTKAVPPLPTRTPPLLPRRTTPLPPKGSSDPVQIVRKLPPLPAKAMPVPPVRGAPRNVDACPPIPTSTRPPPVPYSTRPPPPVPHSARPVEKALTCLRHRCFAVVDGHAALAHPTTSLHALSQSLTDPFSSSTDKARAIFVYLHHNVAYDYAGFIGTAPKGSQDALSVLKSGLAVCAGYAELFLSLATLAGLEAALVSGHGKGYGFRAGEPMKWPPTGHAWNAVRLDDGVWWLIDPCWGAGHVSKEAGYTKCFSPEHFVATPAEFGRRHYPKDEKWKLTNLTWEAYQNPPLENKPQIFACFTEKTGFVDRPGWVFPDKLEPRVVEFRFVKGPCLCEPYELQDGGEFLVFLGLGGDERKVLERSRDGRTWGCIVDLSRLESGAKVGLNYVTTVDGRDARGLTEQEWRKGLGRVGWAWGVLAEWVME